MTRHDKQNIYEEVNTMVDRYWDAIQRAIQTVPAKTVWIGGLHPQPFKTENPNNWSPVVGSFERRWIHVLLINRRLKQHCDRHGYFFNDFTEGYSLPNGDLNMEMTDGMHHLNFWTDQTINSVAQQLMSHRKKVCGI